MTLSMITENRILIMLCVPAKMEMIYKIYKQLFYIPPFWRCKNNEYTQTLELIKKQNN